jgi:hypothetical protein
MRDEDGRIWIGGADDKTAPIRPTGIRQGFIDLGAAATPGVDYASQAGEYAGELVGNSVDVYEKFLKNIPLIKGYVDHEASHK